MPLRHHVGDATSELGLVFAEVGGGGAHLLQHLGEVGLQAGPRRRGGAGMALVSADS